MKTTEDEGNVTIMDHSSISNDSIDFLLKKAVQICSSISLLIGLIVLINWNFNFWGINNPDENFIPMAEETALLFILTGISILLITKNTLSKLLHIYLFISSLLIGGIALLALIDFGSDYRWELSNFLGTSNMSEQGIVIGQMSVLTAICFILISLSLGFIISRAKKYSIIFSSLTLIVGYIIAMGYTYGVPVLYGGTSIPMALPTALSFIFSSLGLLMAVGKENAPIKYFVGDSNQAYLMRNLLPIIFILMLVHDIVGAEFQTNFNSTTALTNSIVDIVFLLVSAAIISLLSFSIGNSIDRNISKRKQSEKVLADERQRLTVIIEGTNSGTWEWNIQTGEVLFNERWAKIIGYSLKEIYPTSIKTWERFVHPDDFKLSSQLIQKHFEGELDYYECETRMKHKNGSWVWVLDRGSVNEWDANGKPLKMSGTHQDITQRKLAEEELIKTKDFLELSIDAASIGTWAHDLTLDPDLSKSVSIRNLRHDEIFGYTKKVQNWGVELFFGHILEEDRPMVREAFESLMQTEKLDFECRILWADQSLHWISVKGKIFKDKRGIPIQAAGTIIDSTQEKLAEIKLREMEEQFETVFKRNPIAMLLTVPFTGEIIDVNLKFVSKIGFAKSEIIGKTAVEIGLFDDSNVVFEIREKLASDSKIDNFECKFRSKTGRLLIGLMSVNLIMYEGQLCQLNSVFDITERKNSELKLQQSQGKLEQAELIGNFGSWEYDVENGLLTLSAGCQLIYGMEKEIVSFDEIKSIRVVEYNLILDEAMKGLIEENKPYRVESKIKRKNDGKVVDILIKAEYNSELKVVHGTTQDITQQKLLESNLKNTLLEADRFRLALDTVLSHTYIKNKKFQYTYANEKTLEMFNCSFNELEGKTDYDFFEEAAANELRETDNYVLAGNNSSKEIETKTIDGKKHTFLDIKTPIYDSDGKTIIGLMGIAHDISERKQMEKLMRSSEEKFKLAFMTGLDAHYIGKLESGLILEVNDEFENITGYTKEEAVGKTSLELQLFNESSDRQRMVAELKANGFVKDLELKGRKKDGEEITASLSSRIYSMNDQLYVIGAIRDITAYKKIENELKQNEEKFRLAFMTGLDAFYLSELESGTIIDVNPAFTNIFGYTYDEAVGKNSLNLHLYNNPDDRKVMINEIKEKGEVKGLELIGRKKSGDLFTILLSCSVLQMNNKSYLLGIMRDISERKNNEEKLKKNNLRLELAMESANMAWWEMDIETGLVKFDKRKAEMIGFPPEKFKHFTDFTSLLHPDDYEKAMDAMRKHYTGVNAKYEVEYRIKTSAGDYKWFYDIGSIAKRDSDGKPITITGLVIDISERKKVEFKIREKDKEFQKLSANVSDLIFQFTRRPDGSYFVPIASQGIINIFGCKPEDVVDDFSPIASVIYPEDAERVIEAIENSAKHITPFTCEFRVQIPGKEIQWIYSRSTPEKQADGSVTWYGFNADITERKKTEELLIKSEQDYRKWFEYYPLKLVIDPDDGTIFNANKAAAKFYGWSIDELKKMSVFDINIDSSYHIKSNIKAAKEHGFHSEIKHKLADGSIKDIEIFSDSIEMSNKKYVLASLIDITERKLNEQKILKLSRIRNFSSKINELILHCNDELMLYREACNIAIKHGEFRMAWVGVVDEKTKQIIPFIHSGFEDNYLSEVKIIADSKVAEGKGPSGRAITEGTHVVSDDIENDPAMLPWKTQAMARGYRSSIALPIKKANQVVGIYTLYAPVPHFFSEEEIKLLNEVADNISFAAENIEKETLRKQNADKMARDEELIRTLSIAIEQSPITVVITDLDGNIVFVNPKFVESTGYTAEEVIGNNPRILNSGYTSKEDYENLWQSIKSGKSWQGTFLNKKKNGQLYWESAVISPVKNNEGEIINFLAVKEDITELRLIEEEKDKLLSDLLQHNKNLEQFAYIVSHNLRTPVANILGLSNLLKLETTNEEQKEMYSTNLLNSVEKLDNVIKDLNTILQVKNQINNKAETIILEDIAKDTFESIKQLIDKEKVTFKLDFRQAESIVSIRSYFHSIILNLITNSIKYRNPDKAPIIKISSKLIGNKLVIVYKDNGLGIDLKAHGNSIFGLYKRFHIGYAEGKGMGLYMVKTQVETLGGTISVASIPGNGTTFTLEFINKK